MRTIYYTADIVFEDRGELKVRTLSAQSIKVLDSTTKDGITKEVHEDIVRHMASKFPYTWARRRKIALRMSDDINKVAPNIWTNESEPSYQDHPMLSIAM